MAKEVAYSLDARSSLKAGVDKLANAFASLSTPAFRELLASRE